MIKFKFDKVKASKRGIVYVLLNERKVLTYKRG